MGFKLVHTEVESFENGGFFRHTFYDLGDGTCIAFFDVHGVGEKHGLEQRDLQGQRPAGVGQPHRLQGRRGQAGGRARARWTLADIEPLMEIDHGWCHSLYYLDPNGIMVEFCRDTPGITPDPEGARSLFTATDRHAAEKTITTG